MAKDKSITYFAVFFLVGMISNILLAGFPILFNNKGMSQNQIGVLISIGFIGAILQPLIGYISDVTKKKKFVLQINFILLLIFIIAMLFFDSFKAYLLLSFLISTVKMSFYGILDDICIGYSKSHGANYAKMRSGASYGFGLGILVIVPFYSIGASNSILYAVAILCLITIIFLHFIEEIAYIETHLKTKLKNIVNKQIILLFIINLLLMSTISLKIMYASILIQNLGYAFVYLAILNFVSALPEMIFLPKHDKIFSKFSFKQLMLLNVVLLIIQTLLYAITRNIFVILLFTGLQGLVMAIFIPSFFRFLRNTFPIHYSASGFQLNAMIQSIATFIISAFIVTPIFSNLGVGYVFIFLAILATLAIIPISLIDLKKGDVYEK